MANFIAEKLESLKSNNPVKSVETITEPVKPIEEPTENVVEDSTPKPFTIPPTCDKLEGVPKNVHYITKALPGTTFVVKLDKKPHIENPDAFRGELRNNLYVYIADGEEYSIDNLRGHWPYTQISTVGDAWELKEKKDFEGNSLVEGFIARLKKLTYINGNLMYEHKDQQYRLQLTYETYESFAFYLNNYTVNVQGGVKEGDKIRPVRQDCDVSYWIRCSTSAGSEIGNSKASSVTYKDLKDHLAAVIKTMIEEDAEEDSSGELRFLQGEYRGTPHHDYKDYDGNPCGIYEYYCSKTWTNEHYTLMTQKGDRAWDIYRWITGYITSMEFMRKHVDYRYFIWLACRLSSIGKTKMLNKCFPNLITDPNPSNGKDTFSKPNVLKYPLLVADDGDLAGLAKNDSYTTRLNKRVGSGILEVRFMRKEEKDVKRTVFNMSISNVEPPKEMYASDNTNIMSSKCCYVYINLSDAIYHDDSTSIINIEEVARQIGRGLPPEYTNEKSEDSIKNDVDMFKSDCLRFYKANPHFMDKYLGAMKQAHTSDAKTCFEDYIDYAEANNAWGIDGMVNDSETMPLGNLFRKQITCLDDYAALKKYFDIWAKQHNLKCEPTQKRLQGIKRNPIRQPMVSKEMIMNLYE